MNARVLGACGLALALTACGESSRRVGAGSSVAGGDAGDADGGEAGDPAPDGEGEGEAAGGGGDEGGDGGGDGDVGDDCPADLFVDVSATPGAGGDYPVPTLSVTCTDELIEIRSNGIPTYEFVPITPNDLRAQDHLWQIPRRPEIADETTAIPLLGGVAAVINGLPIYGPNEGERPDPFGDPVHNDLLDECLGHTAGQGDYHYHALLQACLTGAERAADAPSALLGYAFDGFPIYGPWGCADAACERLIKFESGWVVTGDPTTYAWDNHEWRERGGEQYLDRCNGRVGPDGTYRYHATEAFPYVLGCYRGTPGPSAGAGAPDGADGGGPGDGPGGGPGDGPPPGAVEACEGSEQGAACSFDGPDGAITGECRRPPGEDELACVPEGGPPR